MAITITPISEMRTPGRTPTRRHSNGGGLDGSQSPFLRRAAPIVLLALSGCASVPADLGRGDVDALIQARGQPLDASASIEASAELLRSLTAAPLTPDSAVRIALINSPSLKAVYAELGFAAANVYEAGRIRNPIFSGALLDSSASGERDQLTLGLVGSFTDLITLPAG